MTWLRRRRLAGNRSYRGKVVLVTGASSGIGRRLALDFAARGASLAMTSLPGEGLHAVAAECRTQGIAAAAMTGDLAQRDFAEAVVVRTVQHYGRLDILVNNAGTPKHKHIYDVTPEDVERVMRVNFLAAAYTTLAAIPQMLRQGGGIIVNISSVAGRVPPPRETVYAASKFALTGFTEGLWLDLQGSNIQPVVITAGPIDTEIWRKARLDGPVRFRGKKYPPATVSEAVFRCIEMRRYGSTVPSRFWLVPLVRLLLPRTFRKQAALWDPVEPQVVENARRRAHAGARGVRHAGH